MAGQYKYEAANANGTLNKVFDTQKEAEDFAREKLYDYPTYTIRPVDEKAHKEDKKDDEDKNL